MHYNNYQKKGGGAKNQENIVKQHLLEVQKPIYQRTQRREKQGNSAQLFIGVVERHRKASKETWEVRAVDTYGLIPTPLDVQSNELHRAVLIQG